MPQLIAFGATCAACWFGTKWLKQEFARVDDEMRRTERMLQRVRSSPIPMLSFNPTTGHYHPVD